jgi:hypothetical protein
MNPEDKASDEIRHIQGGMAVDKTKLQSPCSQPLFYTVLLYQVRSRSRASTCSCCKDENATMPVKGQTLNRLMLR